MKLHGKILHHYLSCNSPVDKEGYLYKKGELNTSYQKRWCTLKGNLLFYRERPSEREVLGVIVVEGCAVQLCDSDERFAFSLVFADTGLRTYKFAAENQASQEGWVKALHSASHGFLAVLLQDLRQQYQEIAKAVGVKPLDGLLMVKEMMSNSQKSTFQPSSVFYTPSNAPDPKTTNSQYLSAPSASKQNVKRSPKLWSKRQPNHSGPTDLLAPSTGQWAEPVEDFNQLHELFGKEVRQLVEEWRKRSQKTVVSLEEDLIDLG